MHNSSINNFLNKKEKKISTILGFIPAQMYCDNSDYILSCSTVLPSPQNVGYLNFIYLQKTSILQQINVYYMHKH